MVAIDARESQLNYLIGLSATNPGELICAVCLFPEELHDEKHHPFTGWPIIIMIQQIKIELDHA